MFLSLSYNHPQGSSFVLSALPLLRLFASSFALFGVRLYVSMCVCVPGIPVCGLSGRELSVHNQTTYRLVHRTHTHRRHTATYQKGKWRSKQAEKW
jgi:hypothetical protein